MRKYCFNCTFKGSSHYSSLFEQYVDVAVSKFKQIKKSNCQQIAHEIPENIQGEIVFLFSNIVEKDFTSQFVYNAVKHLYHKCQIDKSVKFCLLDNVANNEAQPIIPLDYESFIKMTIFSGCDPDQYKRIKGK